MLGKGFKCAGVIQECFLEKAGGEGYPQRGEDTSEGKISPVNETPCAEGRNIKKYKNTDLPVDSGRVTCEISVKTEHCRQRNAV